MLGYVLSTACRPGNDLSSFSSDSATGRLGRVVTAVVGVCCLPVCARGAQATRHPTVSERRPEQPSAAGRVGTVFALQELQLKNIRFALPQWHMAGIRVRAGGAFKFVRLQAARLRFPSRCPIPRRGAQNATWAIRHQIAARVGPPLSFHFTRGEHARASGLLNETAEPATLR
jgi:hypothetical protein